MFVYNIQPLSLSKKTTGYISSGYLLFNHPIPRSGVMIETIWSPISLCLVPKLVFNIDFKKIKSRPYEF